MSHTKDYAMRVMLVLAATSTVATYRHDNLAVAQEFKIVVPNEFEDVEGNLKQGDGASASPIWAQAVVLASEFDQLPPSYRWITGTAKRPDKDALLPRHVEYGDYQVRLSTTDRGPDDLSLVFAENVGPDETIVLDRRPHMISAGDTPDDGRPGPREFEYVNRFDTPFYYDPSQGNLLIEARTESGYLDVWPLFDLQDENKSSVMIWAEEADAVEATNRLDGSFVTEFTFAPLLNPGDADQDLDFDQLDLVQVQVAAKYLTGQVATWGEGDWDGAPGGLPGNPPVGDGLFNQFDIIAAQQGAKYLTGLYAAIQADGTIGDGQTSVVYNAGTGELSVDAPAGVELTSINIDSTDGIFTGQAAQSLGGSVDNDADNNIFKATFGSSFGSLSFGNVSQPGLSEAFVLGDLSVVGSLAGGGDLGPVDLVYVPEPTSLLLLSFGLAIGLVHLRPVNR